MKSKSRFIAMLDIMGTKDMVKKNQAKELSELFNQLNKFTKEFQLENCVDMTYFSDSILLYTKDNDLESYRSIIYLSAHIMVFFIKHGIGINGCISFGRCICCNIEGKYITIGKPISDAYLMQSDLFFYGIVIDKKAIDKANKSGYFIDLQDIIIDTTIELNLPLKKTGWKKLHMVNWMEFIKPGQNREIQKNEIRKLVELLYEKNSNISRGSYYIQNTELVMQQWYNFIAEINDIRGYQWGSLLSEIYITKCP